MHKGKLVIYAFEKANLIKNNMCTYTFREDKTPVIDYRIVTNKKTGKTEELKYTTNVDDPAKAYEYCKKDAELPDFIYSQLGHNLGEFCTNIKIAQLLSSAIDSGNIINNNLNAISSISDQFIKAYSLLDSNYISSSDRYCFLILSKYNNLYEENKDNARYINPNNKNSGFIYHGVTVYPELSMDVLLRDLTNSNKYNMIYRNDYSSCFGVMYQRSALRVFECEKPNFIEANSESDYPGYDEASGCTLNVARCQFGTNVINPDGVIAFSN